MLYKDLDKDFDETVTFRHISIIKFKKFEIAHGSPYTKKFDKSLQTNIKS